MMSKMRRIYTIDYLRGILALSVVLYHFSGWTYGGGQDVSTLLGKLGIYAVCAFFTVSGISIYLSYSNCIWNKRTIIGFGARRFFRLAPAYWVAMFLVILSQVIASSNYKPMWFEYFNNITLLFGYFDITGYLVTGGWSIGVEVVFYLLFPFTVILFRNKIGMYAVIAISISLCCLFSFFIINKDMSGGDVWRYYINPFNQYILFVGGMLIAKYHYIVKRGMSNNLILLGASIMTLLFCFYPVEGHWIEIVTGWNRILLISIVLMIVLFVASVDFPPKNIFGKVFEFLGDISYSLYLLHGVLYEISKYIFHKFFLKYYDINIVLFSFFLVLPIVILCSFFCYKNIEIRFIRWAKKMTTIDRF